VDEPTARTLGPDEWFYAIEGRPLPPVPTHVLRSMLTAKQLRPETPVWRPGMPDWAPAWSVFGLEAPVGNRPVDREALERRRQAAILKRTKIDAAVMFGMFLVGVLLLAGLAVAAHFSAHKGLGMAFGPFVLAAGLWAAFYLPLRWRQLKALPRPLNVLGLVGAIGLCSLLALLLLAAVVAVIFF